MTTDAIMSLHPIYRLFSILQMLSFIIFSAPLSNVNLFTMIQLVTPEVCERKSVPRHALLELNLLNCTAGVTALHNKLRAVDSCTTKDTWGDWRWDGVGGERRETRFPSLFKGELKYMYWVGGVIKRNGWGDAGWEQIWKAVEDGGKVMEHHRRIGWNYLFIIRGLLHGCLLHCPVTDEAYLFKWAFSHCYQPTSRVKQCFSFPQHHHFRSFVSTRHPAEDRIVSRQAASMFVSLRDHVT